MGRFAALTWLSAIVTLGLASAPSWAQQPTTQNSIVELSGAHGAGTPGTTDKVVVENVRHIVRTPVSFGAGRFGWSSEEAVYNITYQFDPATLRLVPISYQQVSTTGGTGGCADLQVQVVNSLTGSAGPIADATVVTQSRSATTDATGVATFTGLPPGQSSIIVAATGYGTVAQIADLVCTETNTVAVALSPGAGQEGGLQAGQFRVVLVWGRNPGDLDSHLTGPESGTAERFHVYFGRPNDGGCGLDVDDTSSFGPETISCPTTGTSTTAVLPGMYRYSVHHYSGSGNIGTSLATVRLELGDGTTHFFFPPTSGWTGKDLWTVFELTVSPEGAMSATAVNGISETTSVSGIQAVPRSAGARQPEDSRLFRAMPRKTGSTR